MDDMLFLSLRRVVDQDGTIGPLKMNRLPAAAPTTPHVAISSLMSANDPAPPSIVKGAGCPSSGGWPMQGRSPSSSRRYRLS